MIGVMLSAERRQAVIITIFAPANVHLLEVAGVKDALFEANCKIETGKPYRVRLVTEHGEPIESCSGMKFIPDASIEVAFQPSDTLIVAGPFGVPDRPSDRVMSWLRDQARQARRYGSTCTGAFLLAEAGLLSGCRATTHWQYTEQLSDRFPDIRVEPDSIFVRDGPVFTSAGVSAAIDLAFSLIEEDHGRALALWVARRLVVFLKRPGGQSQFSTNLTAQTASTGPIENARQSLTLETLAEVAGLSPRQFSRLFLAEMEMSPVSYVELTRVDFARRLLEESTSPIKAIAYASGFGSTTTLRRAFLRSMGLTPQQYRLRFQTSGSGRAVDDENASDLS